MKIWHIVAVSAFGAGAMTALVLLPKSMVAADPTGVLLANWGPVITLFAAVYSASAWVLTTGSTMAAAAGWLAPAPAGGSLQRHYLVSLVYAQFFTGILILVCLWAAAIAGDVGAVLPFPIEVRAPALAAAGVLSIAGLLSYAIITLASARARVPRPVAETSQLQLLQAILDLLREQAPHRMTAGNSTEDGLAGLAKRIEQSQRAVLEIIQQVATAMGQLRQSVDNLRQEWLAGTANAPTGAQAASASELASTLRELQDAVAILRATSAKLDGLPLSPASGAVPRNPVSGAELSSELEELLREIAPEHP